MLGVKKKTFLSYLFFSFGLLFNPQQTSLSCPRPLLVAATVGTGDEWLGFVAHHRWWRTVVGGALLVVSLLVLRLADHHFFVVWHPQLAVMPSLAHATLHRLRLHQQLLSVGPFHSS